MNIKIFTPSHHPNGEYITAPKKTNQKKIKNIKPK